MIQNRQKSPVIERLKNLFYLPGEIALLKSEISKLQKTTDQSWGEIINIETKRLNKCIEEMHVSMDLIDGVEDPILRQVLTLHFAVGLGWRQIAFEMGGSYAAYKQMVYRWAQKTGG